MGWTNFFRKTRSGTQGNADFFDGDGERTVQDSLKTRGVLRLPQIVALYTGAVLGSGILILPGVAAELSGPASLLAWGLMAVLVVPMALTMGFLSARYPGAGGVSSFVTKAFNPGIGSLIGWFFLLSVVVGAPVLALTGAGYVCAAIGLGDMFRLLIAIIILSAGILLNYTGMKITGQVQVAVVLTTIIVLVVTIIGSFSAIEPSNFTPFIPYGWESVGHASAVIFWCFIGWEAISHISGEFEDPQRDAIRGTIIAAAIISILYFLTAFVVVGTHSYGPALSDVSLIHIIKTSFGQSGAIVAAVAALFICIAPAIAYIGAASHLACSLAMNGFTPRVLAKKSKKYHTPLGGLLFFSGCFTILLLVFSTRVVSLSTLIQIPSGSFILTYTGGCAAGIVLLKDSRPGVIISVISLIVTSTIFLFVGWAVIYPIVIAAFWFAFMMISRTHTIRSKIQ
jgi:amino acid efflux transporter